jgi:hypothetical protein
MRDVTIGGEKVSLVGSAMTPWIYEEEFDGGDLMADLMALGDKQRRRFNGLPKMAWALARCAVFPRPFPDFHSWIAQIGGWNFADEELMEAVVLEASRACFCGQPGLVGQLERQFQQLKQGQDPGESAESRTPGDGSVDGSVAG